MTLDQARKIVQAARRIVALTGAGMSAESGVPTFRGADGLWKSYRPEELATPEAFRQNPDLVWEWYEWRRGVVRHCEPHAGHKALAQSVETVITQNVDGLHQRAGSRNVIEIHGNIMTTRCFDCGADVEGKSCSACGGRGRPGVVWFGETLPEDAWATSVEAVRSADLLLVIGTSGVVYPASQLSPIARAAGARVIELNLEGADLNGPCGEILPKLLQ
jgi:NAD-dependent deacetylase